ncbi:hypothetical protein [Catenulispora subtropica]|uniref:Integral membrane protein n=1 Tax=Catenulispora subtropica TaxID=450798 RepID=A0ABN2S8P1_9ACTN
MRRFPWGVFIVVAVVLNVVRQIVFPPGDVGAGATVGLFFVVLAVSYAVVGVLRALGMGRVRE